MTASRTGFRIIGCVALSVASATAGLACGTDDDTAGDRATPSTKESTASTTDTTEPVTTEAQSTEAIEDFECDLLDEEAVADIIGDIERSGFLGGQGTVNDTSYDHAGCQYELGEDIGDYEVTAVVSEDVEDIFAFLRDQAEDDEFDDRFKLVDDLGDGAFVSTATGASANLDLFVKVGATTLQVSSDLDQPEESDLDQIEENLQALAELSLEALE